MERKRLNPFISTAALFALGLSCGFGCNEADYKQKPANSNPEISRDKASGDFIEIRPITPIPKKILSEKPLSTETVASIADSLVWVNTTIAPGYEQYRFPNGFYNSGGCSGFIVLDSNEQPLVVTAKHCSPQYVKSLQTGEVFISRNEQGESIFKIKIKRDPKEIFEAKIDNYYIENFSEGTKVSTDVAILTLNDSGETKFKGLAISTQYPSTQENYYRVGINGEKELKITPLFYLQTSNDGIEFIHLGQKSESCISGTSGSAVVNSKGEVVGVLSSTTPEILTEEMINMSNLNPTYKGKTVDLCLIAPSSSIKGLIRNP